MPHAADQRELVAFETHPRAASVSEPPTSELAADVARFDPQARGQAFDDHDQGATV
jgi:hypothetical protein